jgi:uncharacterized protein (DUF58 family)
MLPPTFTPRYLHQLELLSLRTRRAFMGTRQGGHISLKRGHGIEFSDYRQYELGDNPRHIDWGLYARSERLYIKRFREEQNVSLLVLLDASPSMLQPEDGRKWRMARDIGLSIAYVTLMQQDSVRLAVPGFPTSPSLHGAKAIHQLAQLVNKIEQQALKQQSLAQRTTAGSGEQSVADFVRNASAAISQVRFPGMALLLSDLMLPTAAVQQIGRQLLARNLDSTVLRVVGVDDREPFANDGEELSLVDSETGEELQTQVDPQMRADFAELWQQHSAELRRYFARSHIAFASCESSQTLESFVLQQVPQLGILES